MSVSCHTDGPSTSSLVDPYRSFRMLSQARSTLTRSTVSTSKNSNVSGMTGKRRLRRIAQTWNLSSKIHVFIRYAFHHPGFHTKQQCQKWERSRGVDCVRSGMNLLFFLNSGLLGNDGKSSDDIVP
nr:hypothetical protein CFP56_78337 [Quercus suber]